MAVDARGQPQVGALQHGWPKQRVEVNNVLTNKVVQLGVSVGAPIALKIQPFAVRQLFKACHIANRCIYPDVKKLIWRIGDFEAEVGRIA